MRILKKILQKKKNSQEERNPASTIESAVILHECTTLKAQIKRQNPTIPKVIGKEVRKHEVNILIKKKFKKAFKGQKNNKNKSSMLLKR